MFLRPGVDEVLQQLPAELDDGGDAVFEVRFASLRPEDVFNAAIDRHVSEVIVYRLSSGKRSARGSKAPTGDCQ